MIGTIIKYLIVIFLIALLTITINNAIVVGYGMVTGADEINCNWIYCTITYTETIQKCYIDDIEIPCENNTNPDTILLAGF
ncbi:hypothetical protein AYK24_08345 [Thermoplasmatales archaeon SG8-52-4]|nr:MAG: hypothetical protein AYK24_08345 [Thermoplasmatales archaeon SG8-52-4]